MLIRSGISARDEDVILVRNEMNAWLAEVQASLDYVPRANVMGAQRDHAQLTNRNGRFAYITHNSGERPDFILGDMRNNRFNGAIFNDSGKTEIQVAGTSAIAGPLPGVFALLFLDRSLQKEAGAKAGNAAADSFAKR